MRTFWECEEDGMQLRTWVWSREFMCAVWRTCVEKWRECEGAWRGCWVFRLCVSPLIFFRVGVWTDNIFKNSDRHTWDGRGDDIALWEEILGYTTSKVLDHGVESSSVLDGIAYSFRPSKHPVRLQARPRVSWISSLRILKHRKCGISL